MFISVQEAAKLVERAYRSGYSNGGAEIPYVSAHNPDQEWKNSYEYDEVEEMLKGVNVISSASLLFRVMTGLSILSKYTAELNIDYVPKTFAFSSAPDNPSQMYLVMCVGINEVSKEDAETLRSIKWHSEQDGEYWCLMV